MIKLEKWSLLIDLTNVIVKWISDNCESIYHDTLSAQVGGSLSLVAFASDFPNCKKANRTKFPKRTFHEDDE